MPSSSRSASPCSRRPSETHRAPEGLLETLPRPGRGQVRGLDPRRRRDVLDRALPMGEFDFVGDQSGPADPVPVLDLHGAARRCAEADRVGRQHDRQPGPRPLGRRGGPGRHRGLPPAALPLPHRARRVRLRRRPTGPPRRRAGRRRAPSPHDRSVGGRPQRAGVPQLLRRADDRRQRDDAPHDHARHARPHGPSRPAPTAP